MRRDEPMKRALLALAVGLLVLPAVTQGALAAGIEDAGDALLPATGEAVVSSCKAFPVLVTTQPLDAAGLAHAWWATAAASVLEADHDAVTEEQVLHAFRFPLFGGPVWVEARQVRASCVSASATLWGDTEPTRVAWGEASVTGLAVGASIFTLYKAEGLSAQRILLAQPGDLRETLRCDLARTVRPFDHPTVPCVQASTPALPAGVRLHLDETWHADGLPGGLALRGGAAVHLEVAGPAGDLHVYLGVVATGVRPSP